MTTSRSIRWTAIAFVLAVCATAVACDGVSQVDVDFVETDSAGIAIQTNSGPDTPIPVREVSRFGVVDGDPNLAFNEIMGLALDPDGAVWVVDNHPTLRRYSSDGEFIGSAGGEGQGPGEARRGYQDIWATDEHVYAVDWYAGRLQLFEEDGTYLGQRTAMLSPYLALTPLGPAESGWLFTGLKMPALGDLDPHETWVVLRGPATEAAIDSLFALQGRPLYASGDPRYPFGTAPFLAGHPSVALDGSGSIHYSDPTAYRVDVYAEDGALRRSVRRDVPRVAYDPSWRDGFEEPYRDTWRERFGAQISDEQMRDGLRSAFPDEDPAFVPVIDRIFVDRDGALWARRADQHSDMTMRIVAGAFGYVETHWEDEWRSDSVFDHFGPDGRYVGTATVPGDYIPMAISGNRLYAIVKNELDVQFVAVLEIG